MGHHHVEDGGLETGVRLENSVRFAPVARRHNHKSLSLNSRSH